LAKLASSRKPPLAGVFLDVLDIPSICLEEGKMLAPVDTISTSTYIAEGAPSP